MLVFIDESGDPGFKVEKGASLVFVAAMVIFNTADDAQATSSAITHGKARKTHKGEFKFSKCSDEVRDAFFGDVANSPFRVRAIVARKNVIYSPRLKTDKGRFYEFFVRQMMTWDDGLLQNARVVIDGSGDREFRNNLNTALRRKLGQGAIRDVRFKESHRDVLVQLADMCAGAIARSCRRDRDHPFRWRGMLGPRISDVWDFK